MTGTSDDPPCGDIWLDGSRPDLLRMAGEIDLAVTRRFGNRFSADELRAVDVVDLTEVSFVDSAAVSVIANLLLIRPADRPLLCLRGVTGLAQVVLEIAGVGALVAIEGR